MKIEENIKKYLTGEAFNDGGHFDFSDGGVALDRVELLLDMVQGKEVVHLGACDHIGLIEERRKKGLWLHDKLTDVSAKIVGIDIDTGSVQLCKKLGVDNIFAYDITADDTEIKSLLKDKGFEHPVLVAPEMLEHIGNPVFFLESIQKNYSDVFDKIIITVPCAFKIHNSFYASRGIEEINTDHRSWFSPYTLMKVCTDAGLNVTDLYLCRPQQRSRYDKPIRMINRIFKHNIFYDNIVLVAEL